MAHVPDQLVARRIEGVVQRDGQLHDAKAGTNVAAGARAHVDQTLADLLRQLRQLVTREAADIVRRVNRFEQRHE
jgi:hypothetical protein